MQDSTGAFDEMGLTEEELEHMKSNQTLELPPNFFRRFVKTRHHKYLEFIAFKVRDSFPQNIVRMKSGKIVFCNQFVEPRNPGGSITISGFEFLEVRIIFFLYSLIVWVHSIVFHHITCWLIVIDSIYGWTNVKFKTYFSVTALWIFLSETVKFQSTVQLRQNRV